MDWQSLIVRINKRFIKNKKLLCDLIKKERSYGGKESGSCLLWVMSTEISVDIAVDIAVDSRSI